MKFLTKIELDVFDAIFLVFAIYVLSVLFWGWLLMLAMGKWGPYHWSYLYTITHWALLAPFALG